MRVTQHDIENAEALQRRLHSPSKASAVSSALVIPDEITRILERGEELLLRNKDGSMNWLTIPGVRRA